MVVPPEARPEMTDRRHARGIHHLLTHCGNLRQNERVTILCDPTTRDLGDAFAQVAQQLSEQVELVEMPEASAHGEEPSCEGRERMLTASLIVSVCRFSLAHSRARVEAATRGARFLSLPLYSWGLLGDAATNTDFRSRLGLVQKFSKALTQGEKVRVRGCSGTDITLDITGRSGNCCPGFVDGPGDLGSPPDIEANVSPIEDSARGTVVVDGSITTPEIGLLECPVRFSVDGGQILSIESENRGYVSTLQQLFGPIESKRRVLAELGVGLNTDAQLTGTMLTDEGSFGCIHFGFGSNHTVGGQNQVDFHLDCVFRNGTIEIDGQLYLENGELVHGTTA